VGAKRLLVVDDEASIRNLVIEAGTSQGWIVDGAESAAAALACIRDDLYDGAIIDFQLPDMDGIELHSQIRRMDAELAAHTLFVSGVANEDDRARLAAGGGFRPKPFDVKDLVREVKRLLGG
jgi:two-component system OmpR family response regulator